MKFFTALLLTAFLGYVFPLFSFMPWWAFALSSLLVAIVVHQKGFRAFLSGFLGVFLLWLLYAIVINTKNDGILAFKIAQILPLGGSTGMLIFLSAFVGGLVSGMAALTGSYIRTIR